MSRFIAFSEVGATGEVVAPRFREDGTIDEGIVFVINTVGQMETDVSNSFVYTPKNWREKWVEDEKKIRDVPTGANTYLDTNEFSNLSYPQCMQECHDAHVERMRLIKLRDSISSGSTGEVVDVGGEVVEVGETGENVVDNRVEWQKLNFASKAEWKEWVNAGRPKRD